MRAILAALAAFALYGCAMTPQQAQALMIIGQGLQGASAQNPPPAPVNSAVRPAPGACFKSSEQASGMNKLCYYSCGVSADVLLVGVADLCPLTK